MVIFEPIFKLLKKDVATKWMEECQKAFDKIKEYLSNPPVLVPPEPWKPFLLYLSVLDNAFGCILGQHDETRRKEQASYYLSKKFTPCEAKFPRGPRRSTAVHLAVPGRKPCGPPRGRAPGRAGDACPKAIKGQDLADHLAENPVDGDYEPLTTYFLDEEVLFVGEDIAELYPGWRMFSDGATNLKGVGIVAVLISESRQHYPASAKIRFTCTNNMAKYEACILGMRMAVDMNIKELWT
ncbi:PREDICTED: uncharacterized protein LOC109238919 [Nicotiana attenuata]|uniref:uncharacterized protein LOC109238919 n=1 Tax=Nicotiana attenuata TaxID=49451 RepID=UPI000904ACA4|nr:PREDICTED: uncharacterized protein LOC109238919 [Nicotiana attenuata]